MAKRVRDYSHHKAVVRERNDAHRRRHRDYYDDLDEYVATHSHLGDPDEWDRQTRDIQNAFARLRFSGAVDKAMNGPLAQWLIMLGRRSPHDTHKPGETP